MLNHMGFTCWISCEDVPVKIYSEENVGNVRSAWIASEAGKPFAVHWQDKSGKRIATSGHVLIDGKGVASAIIRPGREIPVKREGAKTRRNTLKLFVFSSLALTDDETLASPYDASLRHVGIIRVEISRVRLGAEVPFNGYDEEAKNHGLVHERAKKAGAHCTKFGEAKRAEKRRTVSISTAPYDPNETGPYVIFEFRYRSLEMLRATGIVPNPRKRANDSPEDEYDVIEILSSEDERDSSPTLHPSSPRTSSPDSPSKKRVKVEPLEEHPDLPASSPPVDLKNDSSLDEPECQNIPVLTETQTRTRPNDTQPSDLQAPTLAQQEIVREEPVAVKKEVEERDEEEEEDDEEELDMLPGESEGEGTLSTEPSQNGLDLSHPFSFPVEYPPLSSSPGVDPLEEEEEEVDELED